MKELRKTVKGRFAIVGIWILAITAWVVPVVVAGINVAKFEVEDGGVFVYAGALLWGMVIVLLAILIKWIATGEVR